MTTDLDPGQAQALKRIEKLLEANAFRRDRVRQQAEVSMEEYAELMDEGRELRKLYIGAGGDPDEFEIADRRASVG